LSPTIADFDCGSRCFQPSPPVRETISDVAAGRTIAHGHALIGSCVSTSAAALPDAQAIGFSDKAMLPFFDDLHVFARNHAVRGKVDTAPTDPQTFLAVQNVGMDRTDGTSSAPCARWSKISDPTSQKHDKRRSGAKRRTTKNRGFTEKSGRKFGDFPVVEKSSAVQNAHEGATDDMFTDSHGLPVGVEALTTVDVHQPALSDVKFLHLAPEEFGDFLDVSRESIFGRSAFLLRLLELRSLFDRGRSTTPFPVSACDLCACARLLRYRHFDLIFGLVPALVDRLLYANASLHVQFPVLLSGLDTRNISLFRGAAHSLSVLTAFGAFLRRGDPYLSLFSRVFLADRLRVFSFGAVFPSTVVLAFVSVVCLFFVLDLGDTLPAVLQWSVAWFLVRFGDLGTRIIPLFGSAVLIFSTCSMFALLWLCGCYWFSVVVSRADSCILLSHSLGFIVGLCCDPSLSYLTLFPVHLGGLDTRNIPLLGSAAQIVFVCSLFTVFCVLGRVIWPLIDSHAHGLVFM
jgi:hypothetical protein